MDHLLGYLKGMGIVGMLKLLEVLMIYDPNAYVLSRAGSLLFQLLHALIKAYGLVLVYKKFSNNYKIKELNSMIVGCVMAIYIT